MHKYFNVYSPASYDVDILKKEDLDYAICGFKPDFIIHAAAYTNLTRAESEGAKDCAEINITGTKNVVEARDYYDRHISRKTTPIVYISSDYVEAEKLCFYAITKLAGEKFMSPNKDIIVRTSFKARGTWDKILGHSVVPHPVYTNADFVDIISYILLDRLIHRFHHLSRSTHIWKIGTKSKTLYDLAKKENPEIKTIDLEQMTRMCGYSYPEDCRMILE